MLRSIYPVPPRGGRRRRPLPPPHPTSSTEGKESMNRRRGSMEVMLDRFVFRCDYGDRRFPENETTATSSTCIGVHFSVCIDLATPPAISRFYLQWPHGPKPEAGTTCHIMVAHRDCILFRLTSVVKSKTRPQHLLFPDDYFVYRPGSPLPSLTRLPTWIRPKPDPDPASEEEEEEEKEVEQETEPELWSEPPEDLAEMMLPTKEMLWVERLLQQKHEEEMALGVEVEKEVVRSSLVIEHVGLVCGQDGEYVVAELELYKSNHKVSAELCVLRSGASAQWDLMRLPVTFHKRHRPSMGMQFFCPQAVVPYGDRLCWADYCEGMILANVLEQSPVVFYLPFPPVVPSGREDMHRGVCATDGGSTLKFIDVVVNKGTLPPSKDRTFTICTYMLAMMEDGNMRWDTDAIKPMTSEELWGLEAPAPIPHEVPMFPLVSMDKPQVLRFLLSECTDYVDTVTLVTVDMDTRTVLSVCPYIKGEQDLDGEDADLAEAKSSLLQPFLPAEFSKPASLKRCRKREAQE